MKGKAIGISLLKISVALLFWGAVWVAVSYRVGNDFLFPSPADVGAELWRLLGEKSFWLITLTSLLRVLWGIDFRHVPGGIPPPSPGTAQCGCLHCR